MRTAGRLLLAALVLPSWGACAPATSHSPPGPVEGVAAACRRDAEGAVRVVRTDYAGFADQRLGRDPAITAAHDTLLSAVAGVGDAAACSRAISRWVAAFRDPHLSLSGTGGSRAGRAGAAARNERADPGAPSLHLRPDGVAVLRLRDFSLARRDAIDSLVAAERERLLATPLLIIDVRGNGGGWSGSFRSVLPLLYTGPIRVRGLDVWSSPDNLASMRSGLLVQGLPEELVAELREVVPRMEASPEEFVLLEPTHEISLDTVFPLPRRVGVLIDRGCASSCEQFVSAAAQSGKVVLIGREATRGATDYGNVRTVRLPSGSREMRVPIARWHGIEPGARGSGIEPDLRIPEGEADLVELAASWLAASTTPGP